MFSPVFFNTATSCLINHLLTSKSDECMSSGDTLFLAYKNRFLLFFKSKKSLNLRVTSGELLFAIIDYKRTIVGEKITAKYVCSFRTTLATIPHRNHSINVPMYAAEPYFFIKIFLCQPSQTPGQ